MLGGSAFWRLPTHLPFLALKREYSSPLDENKRLWEGEREGIVIIILECSWGGMSSDSSG